MITCPLCKVKLTSCFSCSEPTYCRQHGACLSDPSHNFGSKFGVGPVALAKLIAGYQNKSAVEPDPNNEQQSKENNEK